MGRWKEMVSSQREEAKAVVRTLGEAATDPVSKPPLDKVGVIYRPWSVSNADRRAI